MVCLILNLLQDETEEEQSVQSLPMRPESFTDSPKHTIFGDKDCKASDLEKKRNGIRNIMTGRLDFCQHRDIGILVKDEKRR